MKTLQPFLCILFCLLAVVPVSAGNPPIQGASPNPEATDYYIMDTTVCFDSPALVIVLSGSNDNKTYDLVRDGTTVVETLDGTGSALTFTGVTAVGAYTVVEKPNNATQDGVASILPVPVMNDPTDPSVCNGQAVAVNFSGTPASGVVYDWTNSNTGIGLGATGSGNISFTATNTGSSNISGILTVTPSFTQNTVTCPGAPQTFTITVKPEPVGSPGSATNCSGSAFSVSLQPLVTNNVASNFSWTFTNNPSVTGESNSSGPNLAQTLTNTSSQVQTVNYSVLPTSTGGCAGDPFAVSLTVLPVPTVADPADVPFCSGAAATVTFTGTVAGTVYNWTNSNTGIGLGPDGSGNISFTATNSGGSNISGNLTVTPSYTYNTVTCTGTTQNFTLTVKPLPVGVAGSTSSCSSVPISYGLQQLITNGVNSTFTWTYTDNPQVTGETNNFGVYLTQTLENKSNISQPVDYTLIPTSTAGSCTGSPIAVTVTVLPEPDGSNGSVTTCSDQPLNFSLQNQVTNGLASSFTWTVSSNPNVSGASAGGGDFITQTLHNVSNGAQQVTYTVTPTGEGNGCVGDPFTVTVTVNPEPEAENGIDQGCFTISLNRNLDDFLQNSSVNAQYIYTVTSSDAANVPPEPDRTTYSSANVIHTYTNPTNNEVTVTYTVTPRYSNGCVGDVFLYQVKIQAQPVVANQALTLCSDVPSGFILPAGTASPATLFNIASIVNNGLNASAGNPVTGNNKPSTELSDDAWRNTSGNNVNVVYTITPLTSAGCTGSPFTVTFTIQPEPAGSNGNLSICSGESLNVNLQGQITNTLACDFSWTVSNNPNVTGASAGSGDFITHTLVNTANTLQNITYTVTPEATATGCLGDPFTYTVTVKPTPVGSNTGLNICSGDFFNVNLQNQIGNNLPSNFSWTVADNPNVTGEAAGSGDNIQQQLTNLTISDQIVVYVVTPVGEAHNCTGAPFTVTVTISPNPTISQPGDTSVCVASLITIPLTGIFSQCTWTSSNPAVGLADGSGAGISFTATNTANNTITSTVTVTPHFGVCTGDPVIFNVFVYPQPKVDPVQDFGVCNTFTVNVPQFTTPINEPVTYSWSISGQIGQPQSSGTGNIDPFTGVNAGTSTLQGVVTVLPATGHCPGNGIPMTFTISVYPTPNVSNADDQHLCEGDPTAPIVFTSDVTGATFTWTNSNPGIGLSSSGSGNIPSFVAQHPSGFPMDTATVIVTPTANGCVGPPDTLFILVVRKPTPEITGDLSVCQNASWVEYTTPYTPGSTYQWSVVGGYDGFMTGNTTHTVMIHWETGPYTLNVTETTAPPYECASTAQAVVQTGEGYAPDVVTLYRLDMYTLVYPSAVLPMDSYQWYWAARDNPASPNPAGNGADYCIFNHVINTDANDYYVEYLDDGYPECMTRAYYVPPPGKHDYFGGRDIAVFSVYPNPVHGSFQLEIAGVYTGTLRILVEDATGRLVHNGEISKAGDIFSGWYVLPGIRQGFYVMGLYAGDQKLAVKKIIVR